MPTVIVIASPTKASTITPTPDSYAQIAYSPDGRYVAKLYYVAGRDTIKISEIDGTEIWSIPTQLEPPVGDPHPHLSIYKWSKDSTTLYFHYVHFPDGGDYAFWWDGFNLQSITVLTGSIQKTLPGEDIMAYAISPDETQIAYTRAQDDPFVMYIRNLTTGSEKKIAIGQRVDTYKRAGNIFWSPSGKGLAFQTEDQNSWTQTIYLNVTEMQMKVVYGYRLSANVFEGWTDDEKLKFRNNSEIFTIDAKTEEMKIILTSTPRP